MPAARRPARWRSLLLGLRLLPRVLAQAARAYPRGDRERWPRQWRFVASALRHPEAHRAMLQFLDAPAWQPLARAHPKLAQKIHKPYPCRGPGVAQRVAIVRRHYALAGAAFGPALLAAVADRQDLAFCDVALPAGQGTLPVRLGKQTRFEREGELTLSLMDPFGSLLYSACFTLVDEAPGDEDAPGQGPVLLVGSLNGTAPRDVLRHITKLSHGLRPASLMVFLLQQAAAVAGARALRAVGRETHAYWGHPRHQEIRFDYDAFWAEEGGAPRPDGLFDLPLAPRRRDAAELPSQKRAQYLRRYAWLDEVAADVARRWSRPVGQGVGKGESEGEGAA